ncbi:MAG TPA: C69 family dipeptidase [Bacteroidales bacterium]|nr:C69 family dipeptidase [Bacteroidales bacterium]
MRKNLPMIVSLALLSLAAPRLADACTNFLITKGASTDGSTMISYSADSHVLFGELYHWPGKKWPEGSMLDIYEWDTGKYLGKIRQAAQTYTVNGNMNEHQVAIGETTYGGRSELGSQSGAIMDYGSLIYVALQRATTAREAIRIMTDLVAEYGYYSSGESFSIADPNEVWIMEMIGKGEGQKGAVWVAVKIPDGYVSGHANQARIQTFPLNDPENCLYSSDVISFAREKGWFSGKDKEFSFSDTYAPVDFGGARFCDARVWSMFRKVNADMQKHEDYALGHNLKNRMPLFIKPERKISLQDMFGFMRDHYEGTAMDMTQDIGAGPYAKPYRWRPMTFKVDGVDYLNERAVATQQTGFSFVTQSRSWLPDPVGGIIWWGVDDAASSVYMPIYTSSTRVAHSVAVGNGDMMTYSPSAAFWIFNEISNFAYTRYSDIHPEIAERQARLENKFITYTSAIDKAATELHAKDPALAVEYLTDYTVSNTDKTVAEWRSLYEHLFTKYMDGNIKVPDPGNRNPKVSQPGYGESWYRKIAETTGDRLKVVGGAAH